MNKYRVNATITLVVRAENESAAEDIAFEALADMAGYSTAKRAAYHEPELIEESHA